MSRTLTQADLDRVAGLPSREAAKVLSCGKTSVIKYRDLARQNGGKLPLSVGKNTRSSSAGASSEVRQNADGSLEVESVASLPQSREDVEEVMRKRGFDPESYTFTYRFSDWEAQAAGGEVITMHAVRAGAVPKREVANSAALDVTELMERVDKWEFTHVASRESLSHDMVLGFADPQLGKVDLNGGTDSTVERVMNSFERAAEILREEKPTELLFADLGDGLENFYNTSSQRETNDLDLTSQVRLLRRLQAEGIRMLAPLVPRFIHGSIPSNHGVVRIGFQAEASTQSNDWGLEVSHQLEDVFKDRLDNAEFYRTTTPFASAISIVLEHDTNVGLVHGHQAGQQGKLADWWMKQAFDSENPLHDSDILFAGHFHNLMQEEVIAGRWVITANSADPGSAWFTTRTGRSATAGMTTFMTAGGKFWDLQTI